MLVENLKMLLGSTFVLYAKTHGFHFNVEGPDFYQYHKFLGKLYEDLFDTIDILGEHIRTLDNYTPGSLSRYLELSKIPEQDKIPVPEMMIVELLRDNLMMIELLNYCFESASGENKQGIADFLAGRISEHEKWSWMLKSMLKNKS